MRAFGRAITLAEDVASAALRSGLGNENARLRVVADRAQLGR